MFSRPSAGYRIVGSRTKINVDIVDVAHDVLIIPERRHDLVFAAAEILLAADDNPVEFGVVNSLHRILEGRRIGRAFTIWTVANVAFRMVAAEAGIGVPIHCSARLHAKSRVAFRIDIFAFVVLLYRLGISWGLGHLISSPSVPADQALGYAEIIEVLSNKLCQITGYDAFSLQPNSGAQGEYAGPSALRILCRRPATRTRVAPTAAPWESSSPGPPPWASRSAISAKEAMRPSLMSSILGLSPLTLDRMEVVPLGALQANRP